MRQFGLFHAKSESTQRPKGKTSLRLLAVRMNVAIVVFLEATANAVADHVHQTQSVDYPSQALRVSLAYMVYSSRAVLGLQYLEYPFSANTGNGKKGQAHLVAIGNLVLAVEIVPNVNDSVHSSHKEYPCSSRAEAPTCQVCTVVLRYGSVVYAR